MPAQGPAKVSERRERERQESEMARQLAMQAVPRMLVLVTMPRRHVYICDVACVLWQRSATPTEEEEGSEWVRREGRGGEERE